MVRRLEYSAHQSILGPDCFHAIANKYRLCIWAGVQHFLKDRMCTKQCLSSACANAQADQTHCFALYGKPNIQAFRGEVKQGEQIIR